MYIYVCCFVSFANTQNAAYSECDTRRNNMLQKTTEHAECDTHRMRTRGKEQLNTQKFNAKHAECASTDSETTEHVQRDY